MPDTIDPIRKKQEFQQNFTSTLFYLAYLIPLTMIFIFRERILISTVVDYLEPDQPTNTHADLRIFCLEYKGFIL